MKKLLETAYRAVSSSFLLKACVRASGTLIMEGGRSQASRPASSVMAWVSWAPRSARIWVWAWMAAS